MRENSQEGTAEELTFDDFERIIRSMLFGARGRERGREREEKERERGGKGDFQRVIRKVLF